MCEDPVHGYHEYDLRRQAPRRSAPAGASHMKNSALHTTLKSAASAKGPHHLSFCTLGAVREEGDLNAALTIALVHVEAANSWSHWSSNEHSTAAAHVACPWNTPGGQWESGKPRRAVGINTVGLFLGPYGSTRAGGRFLMREVPLYA